MGDTRPKYVSWTLESMNHHHARMPDLTSYRLAFAVGRRTAGFEKFMGVPSYPQSLTSTSFSSLPVTGPSFGAPGTSLDSQGVIVSTHSISPLRVLLLYTSSGTYFET